MRSLDAKFQHFSFQTEWGVWSDGWNFSLLSPLQQIIWTVLIFLTRLARLWWKISFESKEIFLFNFQRSKSDNLSPSDWRSLEKQMSFSRDYSHLILHPKNGAFNVNKPNLPLCLAKTNDQIINWKLDLTKFIISTWWFNQYIFILSIPSKAKGAV